MPFNVGQSINSATDSLLKNENIKRVAQNPVYTAIAITIIVIMITMFVFRNSEHDDSLLVMSLRTGFWSLVTTTLVIFAHDRIIRVDDDTNFKDLFSESNLIGDEYTSVIIPTPSTD